MKELWGYLRCWWNYGHKYAATRYTPHGTWIVKDCVRCGWTKHIPPPRQGKQ